jgi:Na+/H+ antiporter NhaA
MSSTEPPQTTRWTWRDRSPLAQFLHTESGSAAVLLSATLAALVWANVSNESYERFLHSIISIRVGDTALSMDVVGWINSGLMTFFFFVIGLEARREFDIGELRERSRIVLPIAAGVGGMLCAALIYVAINAGHPSVHGWGIAMSTDTAFALGMLALVGRQLPGGVRAFLLTVVVVDDFIALVVIATVYTSEVSWTAIGLALLLFATIVVLVLLRVRRGFVYLGLGVATWVALFHSGVEPVVVGLAMGLLTFARPAEREQLEAATDRFRDFREQPTPQLARSARAGLKAAVSPNERLMDQFHPWTSYLVVPLFALANAGIPIRPEFLSEAYRSPITIGIVVAYVVGKPLGVLLLARMVALLTRGRLRPPVGWAAVAGVGGIAGIGFTVSLLIATLAFSGRELDEAKLGVLTAAAAAALLTWVIFRVTSSLAPHRQARAILGTTETLVDLQESVDPDRDHVRGPHDSPVTLVEYGDFECPYCGQAEQAVRRLLADHVDLRYVWRHLPLRDVHPNAQLAAEASEAAGRQGEFWAMHDLLFDHQSSLQPKDLVRYADQLGLDTERFVSDLREHTWAEHIDADVQSADLSGVAGTPTFFINGSRHHGHYDIESLSKAVAIARARASIGSVDPF